LALIAAAKQDRARVPTLDLIIVDGLVNDPVPGAAPLQHGAIVSWRGSVRDNSSLDFSANRTLSLFSLLLRFVAFCACSPDVFN
jgi:hypothetical protein